MSTARRLHYTYEEYLDALSYSVVKLEYCEGQPRGESKTLARGR